MQSASSAAKRRVKLGHLMQLEGYDSREELLSAAASDSVSPAICLNDYTTEMEPDQDGGFCEALRHQHGRLGPRAGGDHLMAANTAAYIRELNGALSDGARSPAWPRNDDSRHRRPALGRRVAAFSDFTPDNDPRAGPFMLAEEY